MVRKALVAQLVQLLGRLNYEFLTLVLTFLKKLSIFSENVAVVRDAALPHCARVQPQRTPTHPQRTPHQTPPP